MNILFVSPETPDTFWNYRYVLPLISKKAAYPPLGLLTVAAMLPREWNLRLVDMIVTRLTDEAIDWADCIMTGGMIVHADSVRKVIARCHARGKTVILGGPLFATMRDRFPEAKHVVVGEAEELMPAVVADLIAGTLKPVYESARRPDVSKAPVPRWDLLNLKHYATMSVQFSRGCPFNCEFCDVIVMNGRVPRVKSPGQMIAELEALTTAGWSGSIFVVDDNFIGNKPYVKKFLPELIGWRKRRGFRAGFITQATVNLADDPALVEMMVQAGFKRVFIGIESPEEESLLECSKVQNTRRNLVTSVRKLQQAGIEVMAGFIVGFDSDKPTIFEQQRSFIQDAGVVTAMVGLLTALPETRLFKRLAEEGRLLAHTTGNNLDAILNFIPKLDRDSLIDGYRRLVRHLYTPREYYGRIMSFLREYRPSGPRTHVRVEEVGALLKSLWLMGVATPGRREYWKFLTRTLLFHRKAFAEAMSLAITGHHFRKIAASI